MQLDIIFGAPQYRGFKSYRYNDKKFEQSIEYFSSPVGEESEKYINKIINLHNDVSTYDDLRLSYGQIGLVKETDGFIFIIFDGYFNEYGKSGYKKNTVFKIDEEKNIYDKIEIELPKTEFIREFSYKNDKMFFITIIESHIGEEVLFELVIYEVFNDNIEKRILAKSTDLFTVHCEETNMYFINSDVRGVKKITCIDLNNLNETKSISIDGDIKEPTLWYNKYKSVVYVFSKNDNNIQVIEVDEGLNENRIYYIEVGSFMNINKILYFENNIYIVIKENSISASIYKLNNEKLEKLISFELNTKINDLFYYNIFLNN